MAFILRRPLALSTAIKQLPKSTSLTSRAFHSAPRTSAFKPPSPITTLAKPRHAFRRSYQTPSQAAIPTASGTLGQRLLYGAAIVGGTVVATNMMFNRETREDGGMPPFERSYLNETFAHTGLGIGMISVAAQALHRSGWSYRLMATNPWIVLGVGLAASLGSMYGTFHRSPDKCVPLPFSPLSPLNYPYGAIQTQLAQN